MYTEHLSPLIVLRNFCLQNPSLTAGLLSVLMGCWNVAAIDEVPLYLVLFLA